MRKAFVELCFILVAIIGIHTARVMKGSFINGKLLHANGDNSVLAISGRDSVRAVSKNGYFGLHVRPGTWKVVVGLNDGAGNVVRENVKVDDGENINLGEISVSE
jgi:hypothetical protein